jgi:hypothetical protein
MVRRSCHHAVVASVLVAAFATPAWAQRAEPEPSGRARRTQDVTPDHTGTPAPTEEAAPARRAPPPRSTAGHEAADRNTPKTRQDKAEPDHTGTPAPIEEAAPARRAPPPRSTAGDEAADRNTPKPRQDKSEPDHLRGVITRVDGSSIALKTRDGRTVRLNVLDNVTVISLSKGSFTAVDFGTYVGAVAVRLEEYSPIVRDSLSWLHRGFELRVIDEQLRGIALGHKQWDLTPDSIIAHGWVDDIEGRVLSIKWGPTEQEETDVETPRDAPVLKMSLGDKSLIKADAHVFAGAQKDADGRYVAVFILVGKDGIVPPM